MKYLNVVGPQIRRLRYQRGWSQSQFAAQIQLEGWDLSRETLAKIECRRHEVTDAELVIFAHSLTVPLAELFPPLKNPGILETIVEELLTKSTKSSGSSCSAN